MELKELYKRNSNPHLFDENVYSTNCGSFALNVTEWYMPYIYDDECDEAMSQYSESERSEYVYELLSEGYSVIEVMERLIEKDFEFILKTCPWLIPIKKEEIDPKDRVIAYRLSIDNNFDSADEFDMDDYTDFHFRVLIDGQWWEKNGAGEVHLVEDMNEDEWWVDDWLVYGGPIKYAKFREDR